MKIVAYCFAAFPFFFLEVVKRSSKDMEWYAITPSYHHRDRLVAALGSGRVLYLQEHLNKEMAKSVDMNQFSSYVGSIYRDMGADKVVLREKPKEYQLKNSYHTYQVFKSFLERVKPDAVFFPIIESHDAMILYKLCLELGIEVIAYTHGRNLGVSFFSPDCFESLPSYVHETKEARVRAEKFLAEFKINFKPPSRSVYEPKPEEVISWSNVPFIPRTLRFFKCRLFNEEPHHISEATVLQKVKVNLLPLMKIIRNIKGQLSRRYCDIRSLNQLPKKFIYYPLHLTPESSINTPAPFFVDQLRSIDLILQGMPSDHLLVVKEHPAVLGMRSFSFYYELRKRPGIVFADAFIPSIEIIKRASLTVSVTGTACLEAFLLGLPSMHLGQTFFSPAISSGKNIDLSEELRKAMRTHPTQKEVQEFIAKVFSVSNDFVFYDPTDPYLSSKYLMNTRNVELFLNSLTEHLKKSSKRFTGVN